MSQNLNQVVKIVTNSLTYSNDSKDEKVSNSANPIIFGGLSFIS